MESPEQQARRLISDLKLDKATQEILIERIATVIKGGQRVGFAASRFGTLMEVKSWVLSFPFCQSCAKLLQDLVDKGQKDVTR